MPILTSRAAEIRRLLTELSDPKRRAGASLRLRSFGSRVVPHVADELGRLDGEAKAALLEALRDVQTAEGRALRKRLDRIEPGTPPQPGRRGDAGSDGAESRALECLRALPPPRPAEKASLSRERGEAHLILARMGSRLARKDLLQSLDLLGAERARLYCEAAGLIGDPDFLAPLARLVAGRPEAAEAISRIAKRERVTPRSRILRTLEAPLRLVVARSIAEH